MTPVLAFPNTVNRHAADAVAFGECGAAVVRRSNRENILRRQLGASIQLASCGGAMSVTVGVVLFGRSPAQVLNAIVLAVAILVGNLMLWRRLWTQESQRDEPVHGQSQLRSATGQADTQVARVFQILLTEHRSRSLPASDASNTPERAYGIFRHFRDGAPLFLNIGHRDILSTVRSWLKSEGVQ